MVHKAIHWRLCSPFKCPLLSRVPELPNSMPVSSFRADCPPCIEPGRLFLHLPWCLLSTTLDNDLFETSSDIRGNCRSCPRPQDILWPQEVSIYQLRNVLIAFLLRNLAFIRLGATSGWDHILNVSLRSLAECQGAEVGSRETPAGKQDPW